MDVQIDGWLKGRLDIKMDAVYMSTLYRCADTQCLGGDAAEAV